MTTGLRKVWEWPACYGRSGYDLSRPILIFVAAKENGFACSDRRGNDPPRPILIFVAAKEMARLQNTTTPTDATILDFRPRLENRCKDFPVYTLFRALILDFKARLANQCKDFLVYPLLRASILDFRAKLANRCSTIVMAVENGPPAASVATTIFRVRFYSSLPRKKMARLQQRQQYGALPCRQL